MVVSSENCDSLYALSLMVIPFTPGCMSTADLRASATIRKSRGDTRGHPCATRERIGNHSL
eukprot:6148574-Prymnesium_polylepis.1